MKDRLLHRGSKASKLPEAWTRRRIPWRRAGRVPKTPWAPKTNSKSAPANTAFLYKTRWWFQTNIFHFHLEPWGKVPILLIFWWRSECQRCLCPTLRVDYSPGPLGKWLWKTELLSTQLAFHSRASLMTRCLLMQQVWQCNMTWLSRMRSCAMMYSSIIKGFMQPTSPMSSSWRCFVVGFYNCLSTTEWPLRALRIMPDFFPNGNGIWKLINADGLLSFFVITS